MKLLFAVCLVSLGFISVLEAKPRPRAFMSRRTPDFNARRKDVMFLKLAAQIKDTILRHTRPMTGMNDAKPMRPSPIPDEMDNDARVEQFPYPDRTRPGPSQRKEAMGTAESAE
jgi:hypothetical protein